MGEAKYRKCNQGDGHGRHGRAHQVFDMLEQGYSADRRCHNGGVGQWRNLVPEIGSGNDCTGYQAVTEALGFTNTHKGDADGRYGCPGTAYHHGYQRTQQTGRQQEELRAYDFYAVADEGGDDAAGHPGARYGTDQQKYDYSRCNIADVAFHRIFEGAPGRFEQPHAKPDGQAGGYKKCHLAGAKYCVAAKDTDVKRQQRHQYQYRYK